MNMWRLLLYIASAELDFKAMSWPPKARLLTFVRDMNSNPWYGLGLGLGLPGPGPGSEQACLRTTPASASPIDIEHWQGGSAKMLTERQALGVVPSWHLMRAAPFAKASTARSWAAHQLQCCCWASAIIIGNMQ